MSHSQICYEELSLKHAWLNLWDKHMTTGRINQVLTLMSIPASRSRRLQWDFVPDEALSQRNGARETPTQLLTGIQQQVPKETVPDETHAQGRTPQFQLFSQIALHPVQSGTGQSLRLGWHSQGLDPHRTTDYGSSNPRLSAGIEWLAIRPPTYRKKGKRK